ncbi:MAG: hypothetical protein F6K23_26685 [Okeania sp. SIO2C9]|uniref:hypothetical protein n=1 Tax=Okeania sp. SIO2C9 TaxID=2607791 RepID=UPI0013BFFAFC|nr:hypothetical protein [Okeania sp. SIO2C9]NEQ76311.1 hypothetical protein [Okeania sp. SIO2C9]
MPTTYSALETLLATTMAVFSGFGGVTFWTFHVGNYRTFIITFQQRPEKSNDGYIKVCDDRGDGLTTYFLSPAQFNGDLNSFTHLKLSLKSEGGDYYWSKPDIRIKNKTASAEYSFSRRPKETWETFLVSLKNNQGWVIKGENGTTLKNILENATTFEIRAEYGKGPNPDCTGLDDVLLIKN